jgi:hypothetical protein
LGANHASGASSTRRAGRLYVSQQMARVTRPATGVLLAAILASSNMQGWIIGLVVAGVSVILSAVLWSSRQL